MKSKSLLILYLFMLHYCCPFGRASEIKEDYVNSKLKKATFKGNGNFNNYTSHQLGDWLYHKAMNHKESTKNTEDPVLYLNPIELKSWIKAAEQKLNQFEGNDFSGSVHGLAYFKASLDNTILWPFMQRLMQAAQGKLSSFSDQDLSGMILDLGKLLGESSLISESFKKNWFKVTTKRLSHFKAQRLMNCLDGLALLNIRPPQPFMQKWYFRCQALIKDFNEFEPIDYSNSLSVLAKHELVPSADYLNLWSERATLKITRFSSRDLSISIFSLSELSIIPSQEFLKAWVSQATSQLNNFNTIELASSIYAFGTLGIKPSSTFLSAWLGAATLKLKDFAFQDLVKSLYGLSQLGYMSKSFQTQWITVANSKLNDFNAQSLSLSLYSFALFKRDPGKDFLTILKDSFIQIQAEEEDYRSVHQVFYACKYFNLEYEISEKAKQTIRDQQLPISSLQDEVTRAIKNLFPSLTLYSEHWIDDICSPIDICIPSKKLIIEVDGPYHYLKSISGELLQKRPQDALKDELLKRSGWDVKRIPYKEWQKLNTPEKQKNYLKSGILN